MLEQNLPQLPLPRQRMIPVKFHLTAATLCMLFLPAHADEGGVWHTDIEAATQKANQEKKDLLIHFAGSDWCGWCMKLEREVFTQKAFTAKVTEDFILVTVDFPRHKELAPGLSQQNAILKKKYTIMTYPTVMLCDAQGRPYARTGYRKGGADAYLEHLSGFQKHKKSRDAGLATAEKLRGDVKARALRKALSHVPSTALSFYEKEIAALHQADPDDVSGFYNRYLIQKTAIELDGIVRPSVVKGDHKTVITEVDNYIRENKLTGEPLQTALIFKLSTHYMAKNHQAAIDCADKIIAINDVNNPGRYASMLKKRLLRVSESK